MAKDKIEGKLDNPVWHSLQEVHKAFGLSFGTLHCYRPDLCPFGGFCSGQATANALSQYALLLDDFFIVGERPDAPSYLPVKNELVCLQMVLPKPVDMEIRETITPLNHDFGKELFQLVNLVQPGYFRPGTMGLGDYYGIFKEGRLVAAAGERMKMNEYTEVSAIVTDPGYTGRGYAKQLIAYTASQIQAQNKTAYLHVAETNTAAIQLYERLGFVTRRKISFWHFVRPR
jgi:GNAT superfamily N-acetyltransferase